ncbi:unnamed protein product [Paramecium sonneborni]|uniref:Uncharacterized protein n=1 Tax=Paramecium sonneborni TaxID=65129 RepID=A0A8S1R2E2_9CILI|nr:unnamed protein product [Paramecium sonneborni]
MKLEQQSLLLQEMSFCFQYHQCQIYFRSFDEYFNDPIFLVQLKRMEIQKQLGILILNYGN